MTRVELTITFTDGNGAQRSETRHLNSTLPSDLAGEQRVAHSLFAELAVTVGEQSPPKHNEAARKWLEFPNRPTHLNQYFDVRNSQAVWIELANLIMGLEADLIMARAFKAREPAQEPSIEDAAALNDLYYVHDRKLSLLNQAVYALIKVQDLVNRLLHESLGGNVVDTSKADWERTQLTRLNVERGLEAKRAAGLLPQSYYDAISEALNIPKNTPKGAPARTYRNRLMHHVRPSVDYVMFFSPLESRTGEELRDAQGNVKGRQFIMRTRLPLDYRFTELDEAFSEYLDAVVAMLHKLRAVSILWR